MSILVVAIPIVVEAEATLITTVATTITEAIHRRLGRTVETMAVAPRDEGAKAHLKTRVTNVHAGGRRF